MTGDVAARPAALLVATVTPNPSIDLLFTAERLVWDDANRTPLPRRRAGGQGINVVRAVRALGGEALAVALLGGAAGAELRGILEAESTPLLAVEAEGDTRVFVAARELETGRSLLLNPRGPASSAASASALLVGVETVLRERRPAWLACSGSVPPGIPIDLYARVGALARCAGVRFVADCDGELLRAAAHARCCDLLVPNQQEAERLLGGRIESVAEAAVAAGALRGLGAGVACITLGGRGAVLAGDAGCWYAAAPADQEGSAVGAGDAFLAALLMALDRGEPHPAALQQAVAAGSAVLKSEGGDLLTEQEYRRQLGRTEVQPLARAV